MPVSVTLPASVTCRSLIVRSCFSSTNLRKFVEMVAKKQTAKVAEMLERGMDPNFHDDDTGETPITIAALQV